MIETGTFGVTVLTGDGVTVMVGRTVGVGDKAITSVLGGMGGDRDNKLTKPTLRIKRSIINKLPKIHLIAGDIKNYDTKNVARLEVSDSYT